MNYSRVVVVVIVVVLVVLVAAVKTKKFPSLKTRPVRSKLN